MFSDEHVINRVMSKEGSQVRVQWCLNCSGLQETKTWVQTEALFL
jgi:hypothetical protein